MKVKLRNPDRVEEVAGPHDVLGLLRTLDIVPESVLVIRDATLLTRDEKLNDDDEVEIRPVLSGGAPPPADCSLSRAMPDHDNTRRGRGGVR